MNKGSENKIPLEDVFGPTIALALCQYQNQCEKAVHKELLDMVVQVSDKVSLQTTEVGMKLMVKGEPDQVFVAYDCDGNDSLTWEDEIIKELEEKHKLNGRLALGMWGVAQCHVLNGASLDDSIKICFWCFC